MRNLSRTPNCPSGATPTKSQPIRHGIPRVALQQGRDLRGARQPWQHRRYTPGPPRPPTQLTQPGPGIPGPYPPQSSIPGNPRVPPEPRRLHGETASLKVRWDQRVLPKRLRHLPVPGDVAPGPRVWQASSHERSAFRSPHPGLTGRCWNQMSQSGVLAPSCWFCAAPRLWGGPLCATGPRTGHRPTPPIAATSAGQQARLLGRNEGIGEVSELGESYWWRPQPFPDSFSHNFPFPPPRPWSVTSWPEVTLQRPHVAPAEAPPTHPTSQVWVGRERKGLPPNEFLLRS